MLDGSGQVFEPRRYHIGDVGMSRGEIAAGHDERARVIIISHGFPQDEQLQL